MSAPVAHGGDPQDRAGKSLGATVRPERGSASTAGAMLALARATVARGSSSERGNSSVSAAPPEEARGGDAPLTGMLGNPALHL